MDWMKTLPNNTSFKKIKSIPMTHNSCMIYPGYCYQYLWWCICKCQQLSIEEQLMNGVRAFDICILITKNGFVIGDDHENIHD